MRNQEVQKLENWLTKLKIQMKLIFQKQLNLSEKTMKQK